jgi:hypothetical protein
MIAYLDTNGGPYDESLPPKPDLLLLLMTKQSDSMVGQNQTRELQTN